MTTTDSQTTGQTTHTYTDSQATDEAVLLLVRKLRRLRPQAYGDITARMPGWTREALHSAEMRADTLRAYDERDGIKREYVSKYDEIDEDENSEA